MTKGYYKTYRISTFDGDDAVIHGGSYAIKIDHIDFITWKKNHETGEYWVKLHTNSSKEIRLKVNYDNLNDILRTYGNKVVHYEDGDENDGMDNKR